MKNVFGITHFYATSLLTLTLSTAVAQSLNPTENDDPFERENGIAYQSAYPNFPTNTADLKWAAIQHTKLMSENAECSWQSLGPAPCSQAFIPNYQPYTGRVTKIVVHPNNPSVLYLGAATGGLWKSTNAGASWTCLTNTLDSLASGDIVIVPHTNAPDEIFYGTGDIDGLGHLYYPLNQPIPGTNKWDANGFGIFHSTDGGVTWGPLGYSDGSSNNAFRNYSVNRILRIDAQTFYVATGKGLYRSLDGGESWAAVISNAVFTDVVRCSPTSSVLYATAGWLQGETNNGLWRSSDGGLFWTKLTDTIPSGVNTGRVTIAISPSAPNVAYATFSNPSNQKISSVYKTQYANDSTQNPNLNWQLLPTGGSDHAYYSGAAVVHPANPNRYFTGIYGLVRYTKEADPSTTYNAVGLTGNQIGYDIHCLAFAPLPDEGDDSLLDGGDPEPGDPGPQRLYIGSDVGIYYTDGFDLANFNALTGVHRNNGLSLTQFFYIGLDPD